MKHWDKPKVTILDIKKETKGFVPMDPMEGPPPAKNINSNEGAPGSRFFS